MIEELASFDPKACRRFFAVSALLAGVLLLLTAGVNLQVDPTGEMQSGWLPPLSESTRDIKLRRLHTIDRDTSVLVLGSSRCLRIEPTRLSQWLEGKAYNAAVNMGDPQDFHALLGIASEVEKLPVKEVILGLDLEGFSPSRGAHKNLVANFTLLDQIPDEFRPEGFDTPKAFRALSWDKTRMSLKALNYEFIKGWPEPSDILREDGVRIYTRVDKALAAGTFDLPAAIEKAKEGYRLVYSNFPHLDPHDLASLQAFFDRCDTKGIRVHCFLTPLHPVLLAHVKATSEFDARREEFLRFIRAEASKRGYRFFDASELAYFGGDPEQYYDGSHMFSENSERLLAKLFEVE